MEKPTIFYLICFSCLIALTRSAPSAADIDLADSSFDGLAAQGDDYNSLVTNFKDFFMYLPVMFSTVRETISGFPKLAESIRILTSPYERSYPDDEDECKCKTVLAKNNNEIDKSSNR